MLRDNLVELIEPMLHGAGPLALSIHNRPQASDDRFPCLENPRPKGAESSLTENVTSPFQAEPAQLHHLDGQAFQNFLLGNLQILSQFLLFAIELRDEMFSFEPSLPLGIRCTKRLTGGQLAAYIFNLNAHGIEFTFTWSKSSF